MKKANNGNKLWILLSLGIIVLLTVSILLSGCNTKEGVSESTGDTSLTYDGQELIISGSTTLLQVSEAWASAFMEKFGGTIIVNGGGSGGGIADLINGVSELANSSREIKDEELEAAKAAGLDVQEYMVLFDGIAVIVSSNVPVGDLTIEQLSKYIPARLLTGKMLVEMILK